MFAIALGESFSNRYVLVPCEKRSTDIYQALVIAHEDNNLYGEVLKSIVGVVFLATPHRGSQSASLGNVIGTIINTFRTTVTAGLGPRSVRTDLLQTLIYDNDALEDLSMSARSRLGDIAVVSCYENEPMAQSPSLVSRHTAGSLDRNSNLATRI